MKPPLYLVFIGAITAFFFIPTIAANCDLQFTSVNDITWRESDGGYSPYNTSTKYHKERITITNYGTKKCSYFVTTSKGNSQDPNYDRTMQSNGTYLHYQIHKKNTQNNNEILKEDPDLQSNKNVMNKSNLKAGKSKNHDMHIFISKEQTIDPGTYTDNYTLNIYKGSWTNSPDPSDLHDTKTIQLSTEVQKIVYLNIGVGNIGNQLTIDFGNLSTGLQEDYSIQVVSNSDYDITIQSQNNGTLKNTTYPNSSSTIPYTFTYDGQTYDLSSGTPVKVIDDEDGTSGSGIIHDNFKITIGAVGSVTSGQYSDNLTVNLISL